jgi:hypothetical protein
MQTSSRDPSSGALPPALICTAALTCGVLAALALQIYLSNAGFDYAALWENLLGGGARELRTTGPWWAIAGVAFVTGGVVAAALVRLPPPWQRFRALRWAAGAVIVLLLAHVGHSAASPEAVGAGMDVVVGLAALAIAALVAGLGAYLAMRR